MSGPADFDGTLRKIAEAAADGRFECTNCAWFAREPLSASRGRCFRFPPKYSEPLNKSKFHDNDIRGVLSASLPVVVSDWACGEFMDRKTGDTPYASSNRLCLAARVAELEERVERMMTEGVQ